MIVGGMHAGIAVSDSAGLYVVAPPGTGKTQLLAARADFLASRLGPHQQILALTFSNMAKLNLSVRMAQELGAARFRRHVRVLNFHGHAAEIVRSHARTLGIDPAFPMPDRRLRDAAVAAFLTGATAGDRAKSRQRIETALRMAKNGPRDDAEVLAWLIEHSEHEAAQIERDRVEAGQLHYEDLLRHAQRLLRIDAVAHLYRLHYGAVLVDEFQDMSLQHLDIAFRTCTASRMFVGDPHQGIYSFAGADPARVEARLRGVYGSPIPLAVSYRSSPAVLGVVNAVGSLLGATVLHAADAISATDPGVACAKVFDSARGEAEAIVALCADVLADFPGTSIGVIVRSAWRRVALDQAFAQVPKLPRYRWDVAIDNGAVTELLRQAMRHLPPDADLDALRQAVLQRIDPADVETYQQTVDALELLARTVDPGSTASYALDQVTFRGFDRPVQPGIHVLNAHNGKGQQFDWVIVPGLEDGHIPGFQAQGAVQQTEELRVLLVMLSRARRALVVTRAASIPNRFGGVRRPTASPWWDTIALACTTPWEQLQPYRVR